MARQFGLGGWTADKAINQGWPERGIQGLRDRLAEHTRQRQAIEAQRQADLHREQTDEWYRTGKKMRRAADLAIDIGTGGLAAVLQATTQVVDGRRVPIPLTKRVRRRRMVQEGQGEEARQVARAVEEDVPLTAPEVYRVKLDILRGMLLAQQFHRLWAQQSDSERADQGGPREDGLASLTEEQLQYMVDHLGQVPPGVDEEVIFGPARRDAKRN
jgi:hypothetical protein